jgi:hypothetical protein
MEIVPPSFTGDPNSARCSENSFKYAFYAMNAAVLIERFGFGTANVGFTHSADTYIALAEEQRARRTEASGKTVTHRRHKNGKFGELQHRMAARWKREHLKNNM